MSKASDTSGATSTTQFDVASLGLEEREHADPDVKEFIRVALRVDAEEKQSDPEDWTPAQKTAYAADDWREFSRLRGYTPTEIANYGRFIDLANLLDHRYGENFSQSLSFAVQEAVEQQQRLGASSQALRM